jgi:outer membrane protein OmpA-like peptidoglycan-associated protein
MSRHLIPRFWAVALVSLALGCTVPHKTPMTASPIVPGSNERLVVDQVVLVLDSSHSVGRRSLFPEERALVESFVAAMPSGSYEAGLIVFGGEDQDQLQQPSFDRAGLKQSAYDARHIGEGTPIHDVISQVGDAVAGEQGHLALVVFSDGRQTNARGAPIEADRVIGAANDLVASRTGTVCIHTVQVGNDAAGGAMLRNLAAVTDCGSAREMGDVSNASALEGFERQVFLAPRPAPSLPPVAAAPRSFASVLFPFDSTDIETEYQRQLDGVVAALREDPNLRLGLGGHTDAIGSDEYNQALSVRRGDAVRAYLRTTRPRTATRTAGSRSGS